MARCWTALSSSIDCVFSKAGPCKPHVPPNPGLWPIRTSLWSGRVAEAAFSNLKHDPEKLQTFRTRSCDQTNVFARIRASAPSAWISQSPDCPAILPLPSPSGPPNKSLLTTESSGCTAFGHPAGPRKDRSPRQGRERISRGETVRGVPHWCGARGPSRPMFLWTTTGVACGKCHARRRSGLCLKPFRVEVRQP